MPLKKNNEKPLITTCTKAELRRILGFSRDTLIRRLRSIGIKHRDNYLSISDLKEYNDCFGLPAVFAVAHEDN